MNRAELARRLRYRAARDPLLCSLRALAESSRAQLWLVGGAVRDAALGRRAVDIDLAGGAGCARLVRALQSRFRTRGFRVRKRGVTTWRTRHAGRDIDLVDASRRGLIRDLERREFTLNAIGYDLLTGEIHDPLHGLRDLQSGWLRVCSERAFRDDPLRVLRAARFVAQLPQLRLHRSTRSLAPAAVAGIRRVSAERVRDELNRLLAAVDPLRGLDEARRLGVLWSTLPELAPLENCAAGAERPDVWSHTLLTLDQAVRGRAVPGRSGLDDEQRLVLRWSLLLHDIAKPDTLDLSGERPTFHGHETLGATAARRLMLRLRQPRRRNARVERLVRFHLRPHQLAQAGQPARGMRRLVRDAGDDLGLLLAHAACDARGSGAPDARQRWPPLRAALAELQRLRERVEQRPAPLLGGREVMQLLDLASGPQIGEVLEQLAELQLAGTLTTAAQARRWLRNNAGEDEPISRRSRPR